MTARKKQEKKQEIEKNLPTPDMTKVTSDLAEATSNLAEVASNLANVKSDLASPKEEDAVSDVSAPASEAEVIDEGISQDSKSEAKVSDEPVSAEDPLNDFKEKMVKEEFTSFDNAPKKNYLWPILFIFIAAVVLLSGIFAYKQGIFKAVKINVPVATPTPTAIPVPTIAPDLTKFEIEILNGSGVNGEATRQKLSLTTEGFTISSVGNADNSDYTNTIIKAKAEVDKSFVAKLKSTLESSFTTVTEEVLSDTSSVPVVVILGTKI